ncbi:MAG: transcription termination factor Rho [Clostridia bacterium]|nr:transcription termination factor Rho [Clostridia bacterium]
MRIYTRTELEKKCGVEKLRDIMRDLGRKPRNLNKNQLIESILLLQDGKMQPENSNFGRKPRTENDNNNIKYEKDFFENIEVREDNDYESVSVFTSSNVVKGVLEFHEQGFAFLRGENYEADASSDVYVSKSVIRNYRLRRGDYIEGYADKQNDNNSPSLYKILKLNGRDFDENLKRPYFDDLTPCYPNERISLECADNSDDISIRAIDLLSPIGRGQRGLIVAPPKAGKTTLIKKIANSIENNHKDIKLIVLLIDERPEEVTDLKRYVNAEVIYSTFDESPEHHVRIAELALNRGKRLVEMGDDVVILLDSITKLTRAYNTLVPSSGRTLSGGIEPLALQAPKKFFGSARNFENGGSLTILSTALIETGSKMDDVIYEEFKGTGNMEIILSRALSERRIFPAIDLYRSGTRRDDLLLSEKELDASFAVRRYLDRDINASQNLIDMLKRTKNNDEFVQKAPVWCKMMTD